MASQRSNRAEPTIPEESCQLNLRAAQFATKNIKPNDGRGTGSAIFEMLLSKIKFKEFASVISVVVHKTRARIPCSFST